MTQPLDLGTTKCKILSCVSSTFNATLYCFGVCLCLHHQGLMWYQNNWMTETQAIFETEDHMDFNALATKGSNHMQHKIQRHSHMYDVMWYYLPVSIGWTPLARQSPPKRLLNIWFSSNVAVALFVISTPAASPSNIRFRLRIGWLCVDIRTPACALRKMSFSSKIPWKTVRIS